MTGSSDLRRSGRIQVKNTAAAAKAEVAATTFQEELRGRGLIARGLGALTALPENDAGLGSTGLLVEDFHAAHEPDAVDAVDPGSAAAETLLPDLAQLSVAPHSPIELRSPSPSVSGVFNKIRSRTDEAEWNDIFAAHTYTDAASDYSSILGRISPGVLDVYQRAANNGRVDKELEEVWKRCVGKGPGTAEAVTDKDPKKLGGAFWMNAISDLFGETADLVYGRGGSAHVAGSSSQEPPDPQSDTNSIGHERQFDAYLACQHAEGSHWHGTLVGIEFSKSKVALDATKDPKVQQMVLNVAGILVTHATRDYIIGMHISNETVVLVLLDRECLHLVTVKGALSTLNGRRQFAALLFALRQSSIYELGFSPLWSYSSDKVGRLRPLHVHLPLRGAGGSPLTSTIKLAVKRVRVHGVEQCSPFHRATLIVELDAADLLVSEGRRLLLKKQAVSDNWRGEDSTNMQHLRHPAPPDWAPKLLSIGGLDAAFLAPADLPWQLDRSLLAKHITRRHDEYMVLDTMADGDQLERLRPRPLARSFKAIVEAVCEAFDRYHLLHQDISSGNLVASLLAEIEIIDWEFAKHTESKAGARGERTGTLETACLAVLEGLEDYKRGAVDDLESLFYVLIKILWQRFAGPLVPARYLWETAVSIDTIISSRVVFCWTRPFSVDWPAPAPFTDTLDRLRKITNFSPLPWVNLEATALERRPHTAIANEFMQIMEAAERDWPDEWDVDGDHTQAWRIKHAHRNFVHS